MTSGASDLIEVCGEIRAQTEKAIKLFDGTREAWLPISQIEVEKNADGTVTVTLPEWLATDKGLT